MKLTARSLKQYQARYAMKCRRKHRRDVLYWYRQVYKAIKKRAKSGDPRYMIICRYTDLLIAIRLFARKHTDFRIEWYNWDSGSREAACRPDERQDVTIYWED